MASLTRTADDAGELAPSGRERTGCLDGAGHRMRVVGAVPSGPATRLDCEHPLRAVCRDCESVDFWRCDSYSCGPCGEAKRRRLARLVDNGAAIHLSNGRIGYFLTLTAPGTKQGHLRWYQGKKPSRRVECGCEDHGHSDGSWNAQESACWNRLRTSLTRERSVTFCGAVETQARGMLHRHVLMFVDDVLTHEEVQALALAAGYGCVLDLEPVRSSEKAARYISKYVTKASSDRAVVPWERLDEETGELIGKRATYRLWSSSRRWGVTMKEIRAAQSAQARARANYLREWSALLADDVMGHMPPALADSPSLSPP